MIENYELLEKLDQLLLVNNYKDYCPNGLQIEGSKVINKIITGVSLNQKLIDIAIQENAQAIIVHHGIFWNKDDYSLKGIKKDRIKKLLQHDINLYAYHLPLDNHPVLGNNIQLAKKLNIQVLKQTADQNLLWVGELNEQLPLDKLIEVIYSQLSHKPMVFGKHESKQVKKIAWCTGAADMFFSKAIDLGVDAYITGEPSESVVSLSEESDTAFIAAGHYATERYGIQALSKYIKDNFLIPTKFIELYTMV